MEWCHTVCSLTASGCFYSQGESLRGLGSHLREPGKQENGVYYLVAGSNVIIACEIPPREGRRCLGSYNCEAFLLQASYLVEAGETWSTFAMCKGTYGYRRGMSFCALNFRYAISLKIL